MILLKVFFSENAERELGGMDPHIQKLFLSHVEKLVEMPPRRHLRFGMPFNVEDVTRQARMVYEMDGEDFYVLRCFKTHKEYERWYKSFR